MGVFYSTEPNMVSHAADPYDSLVNMCVLFASTSLIFFAEFQCETLQKKTKIQAGPKISSPILKVIFLIALGCRSPSCGQETKCALYIVQH